MYIMNIVDGFTHSSIFEIDISSNTTKEALVVAREILSHKLGCGDITLEFVMMGSYRILIKGISIGRIMLTRPSL